MRVLVLGYPMPNIAFDNYTFLSAPAFFDYDAIVVDPLGVSRVVEEVQGQTAENATFTGQPVVNGPGSPVSTGLAEQLLRRRGETEQLLARGGAVVCLLRPNAVHGGVSGFSGCDRYYWLPAQDGMMYGSPHLLAGEGRAFQVLDQSHSFSRYIEDLQPFLRYYAYLAEDRIPHFASFARVFARSTGGAAAGVDLEVGGGHILFLPPPDGLPADKPRYEVAQSILHCLEAYLGKASGEQPSWVEKQGLPGLDELLALEERAAERAAESQDALEMVKTRREELDKYRRLLWQEGKLGLESIVRDALRLLGFEVTGSIDQPAEVKGEGAVAFLEVEGSEETVGMAPHYRLRGRREGQLVRSGEMPRGLIVINGQRQIPIEERTEQYTNTLMVAAESMRYCLVTTSQLFYLVRQVLQGMDVQELERIREALLNTEGEFKIPGVMTT